MKLSAAFAIIFDLSLAIRAALPPTLAGIFHSPLLIFQPATLSRMFMAHVWVLFGNGVDTNARPEKERLIPGNAYGVVLDIGAGHGHTVNYLDRSKVTKYVALEPNTLMHSEIRALANAAGYSESDGTLLIISSGAEDTASLVSAFGGKNKVDTLISILTLCTVPNPERVLRTLVNETLKPGGQLLFYEHVKSHHKDVAWWQGLWTPIWTIAFDGCRLDRPTHLWIEGMGVGGDGVWKDGKVWGKEGESEENLFWHRAGKFVKAQ
jgi:SAM-dependent methyltransferase